MRLISLSGGKVSHSFTWPKVQVGERGKGKGGKGEEGVGEFGGLLDQATGHSQDLTFSPLFTARKNLPEGGGEGGIGLAELLTA